MAKICANGVNLHYISVGAGPDIVMLHGFLGNLAVWHLYMTPILRREHRVITYDLRGHGYSDVPLTGYTVADMAEDLRCFLDAMGIKRPILVGHSFGADICMYFSLLHPERVTKLVALEPGLAALVHMRNDKDWVGWSAWVAKLEEAGIQVPEDKRSDAEYLLQVSLETPKFYGPARGLPRNREPLLHLIRNTSLLKDYEVVGAMTLDAVRTIRTPTLLVYGHNSHFISSYEFLHRALPNCKPVLLPGGEHFGPLEQPELLTQHIVDFVKPVSVSGFPPQAMGEEPGLAVI
ncbi:MAG TPA: alpha/beta hydrolase [Bryobacteraceae bacterium]|nr:alpha/beta hydrolase [Bryobacteraceae bacterium]